ncbi:apolipoprotein N-acyltransferase [Reinekea marina]|uniref:Apolipoprotein N-acyltransferase n=1 Tax=Reinekea marina TaxID=1310421 RepID=A0ABV7WSS8_9GAMM
MFTSKPLAVKIVVAFAIGLCIPLSLAPFNIWPLALVGIAGFFWLQSVIDQPKVAFWLGWVVGIGFFGLGVSWVYGSMRTVDTPVALSFLLTAAFCGALAFLTAIQLWFHVRFLQKLKLSLLLASPLSWLFFEWLREWFLTGMPWLFTGYAVIDLPMAQLAAIIGVYGLSLILAFISALLLLAVLRWQQTGFQSAVRPLAGSLLVLLSLNIAGLWLPADYWTQAQSTVKVAAIQSNIAQQDKWKSSQQLATLQFYGEQIETLPDVDIMLWPEAAMTRRADQIPNFMAQVQSIMSQRDQTLLTGVVTKEGPRYFNAVQGHGMAQGEEYRKQHLVPFGEYVPFDPHLRNLIGFFNISISGMSPALKPQTPLVTSLKGEPIFLAPVICYEAAYPDIVRKLAKESQLLTTVSNDAWFGDSIAPHQHLQITRMRSIENGRDMARATQNGLSALMNAQGKLLKVSEQFTEAQLIGELTLRSGLTPFQRYPSATLPIIATIILVILLLRHYRYTKKYQ